MRWTHYSSYNLIFHYYYVFPFLSPGRKKSIVTSGIFSSPPLPWSSLNILSNLGRIKALRSRGGGGIWFLASLYPQKLLILLRSQPWCKLLLDPGLKRTWGLGGTIWRKHNLWSQTLSYHMKRSCKFDPFYPSRVRVRKGCRDFLLHYHNFADEDAEAHRGDITHAWSHNNLMVGHRREARSSHDTLPPNS